MLEQLTILNNGLLILVLLLASLICSVIVTLSNPKVSKLLWSIRWTVLALLYPQRYIHPNYADAIPFVLPNDSPILIVGGVCLFLFYDLITGTKRGRQVRRKFKILPQLIPMDDYYEVEIEEPEDIDGSSRQLKGEIIQNEHDVLQSLLGHDTTEELNQFSDTDATVLVDEEETMPLSNQNFPDIKGRVENTTDNLEFCESCSKPVKKEWKACPFCGEFLEIYEDDD